MGNTTTQQKSIHNGTCQCCGRVQAILVKNDLVAKHGYTLEYGFFNGACPQHLPLEESREELDLTVAGMRLEADRLDTLTVADVTCITVRQYDTKVWKYVPVTFNSEEEWDAFRKDPRHGYSNDDHYSWTKRAEGKVKSWKLKASSFRSTAAQLLKLAETRHGQPLYERKAR